ncbi:MAG: serine hydrolase [Micrococcales bacterium]|nr:serine hydrolase [Micrococcales bacterium]
MALPAAGGLTAAAAPEPAAPLLSSTGRVATSGGIGAPKAPAATAVLRSIGTGADLEDRLSAAILRAMGDRAADVSVTVHDRLTDAYVRHNPSLRNPTGSIVKVLVLVTLVRERREDGRSLSNYERSLARRMITTSDNDATSALFDRLGGRSALQRVADRLGMTRTQISTSWGRSTTTAADQALLVDRIMDGDAFSDRDDQAYVLDLMGKVIPEQAWGVGSIPDTSDVALKNGWVLLEPHGWRVNSIGHVTAPGRDYTLAMLSYDSDSMEEGVEVLDAVAAAVYDTLEDSSSDSKSMNDSRRGARTIPKGAPAWLHSPGAAFPPYPVW